MNTVSLRPVPWHWLVAGLVAWVVAYASLIPFADTVIALFGLTRETHLGEALHFFFYDTPKVLLLLTGIVFLMGVVHTFVASGATGPQSNIGANLAATLTNLATVLNASVNASVTPATYGSNATQLTVTP